MTSSQGSNFDMENPPQFTIRVPNEWIDSPSSSIEEIMDVCQTVIEMAEMRPEAVTYMQYMGVLAKLEKDEGGYLFQKC